MKKTLIALATIALMATNGFGEARTWTSADGSKTFEGSLRSYNAASGDVTMLMSNGRSLTFPKDKLSKDDIKFLEEWDAKKNEAAAPAEPTSKLGKLMTKAKLHKLDGKRFKSAELTKSPEYFILYYSASW